MELNADFSERVCIHADQMEWVPSPIAGVDRRMLDRIGDEVARATSIVRYAPNSHFSPHIHHGGEEFLVLDGVFEDEHGKFPAGSYIRNPPTSKHTPGSVPGCVLFVKLWQFDLEDRTHVRIDTNKMALNEVTGRRGVKIMPLFHDAREDVRIEEWPAGGHLRLQPQGGVEILVLAGRFHEAGDVLVKNSWLRLPVDAPLDVQVGEQGCRVWIKEGHLRFIQAPSTEGRHG